MQRLPHIWLLIAKWALANWRPDDRRPEPADEDVRFVVQSTWDAIGQLQAVEGRPAIFMRRMALQQIWLQRSFDASSIPRQLRILGELMAGSAAMARFREAFGISAAEFAVQLAHMAADAGDMLRLEALAELRPQTPRNPDHWQLIRRLLNRNVPAIHEELAALQARNTPAEVEVCEQSPLVRTPFLEAKGLGPVCIHHKLLFRNLESVVFDLARSLGARPFMNDFGPAFENFVAEVIEDLHCHSIREEELKGRLLGEGQVVDFALVFDEVLVLIDAKGIEGHYDELYHNLPAELAERLRTSLLRAADQAIATVARLPEDLRRAEIYFLCVTFKQVVVTDGIALRELTIGTEQWNHERWNSDVLTPARMFFPSVYEFESMIALATAKQIPLSEIVQGFVADNSDPATRKLLLEQHVMAQHIDLLSPSTVQTAADRLRR
ncbi:hypothetical protein [Tahibacter soli]|uniref:Uncharacterized protein n=1 Tax=Tahibacter soli TaxID=2983605 RepID=A0A9X3YI31_9GAMM|nr:hypothetical protein [Tahibacter soli]MDC8012804.1 hypothetical protein [Tahibacter soli]